MDNEIGNCDNYYCELCSLDFTTRRELEEHTWSILHHTNLSKEKGSDCKHPCSLCKQEFTRLSEFTSHLHGDSHQENIHKWRRDHQQEWSPDKKQLASPGKEKLPRSEKHKPQIPEKQKLKRQPQEKEEGELSDWAADDFTGVKNFQNCSSDQDGETIMDDYRSGHQHPYGSYPSQDPQRAIPSLLDPHLPPASRAGDYGFHYQEEEMRRVRGPISPRPNDVQDHANDSRPVWNGFDDERDFREPSYDPGYARMNHSRNYDRQDESYYGTREGDRVTIRDGGRQYASERQNGSYYRGREEERMLSRDGGKPSPSDSYSDGYAPGSRRRVFVGSQPGDLRDRISRRGNTSSHDGRQRIRSVVGSSFTTFRENDERSYSRQTRRDSPGNRSRRETPSYKQEPGRRKTSQDNKEKDIKEGSQTKTSPSSESPGGKSGRKGKPRKLARAEEQNKDDRIIKNSASKNVEVNSQSPKGKESEGKNSDGNKTMDRVKYQTQSGASSQQVNGNRNGKSKIDSQDLTTKNPSASKGYVDVKENNTETTKTWSTSLAKGDTPSPAKGTRGLSSPPTKRKPSSSGNNDARPLTSKRDSSSAAASLPGNKYDTLLSVKGNSPSSVKEGSSLLTKNSPTLPVKESSIMAAKEDSFLQNKGALSSSANPQSSLATRAKFSLPTNTSAPTLTKEEMIEKAVEMPVPKASDESLKWIKNGKEEETCPHEKVTSVTFLDEQMIKSQDSKEAGKKRAFSSSSMRGEKDLGLNTKEQSQSLSSLSKNNEGYLTNCTDETSNLLPENTKEKTADNQGTNSSKEGEQTNKSSTTSTVCSLPWEKREEQLRALLGIKKEPKDLEEDTIPCPVSRVALSGQKNVSISTSSAPTVNSSTSFPSKPNSSRDAPVISQLPFSQSQCSIVHIDGTPCGAVAENKYCPYHQRVFKSEEGNARGQNLGTRGNQFRGNDGESDLFRTIRDGRKNGAQIFRPITPPCDPPDRLGFDGGKTRQKQDNRGEGGRNALARSKENDLNSKVPNAESRASNESVGTIDLNSTVQGVPRNLFPCESANGRSGPNIDLSDRVPTKPPGITLEAATTSDTGIDLSGTVPNLEELLALHGSSADATDGPKIDLYKTGLKHGQFWNQQGLKADARPTVDRSLTAPSHGALVHLGGSSSDADNVANIDLNEITALPGSSRVPLDSVRLSDIEHRKAQASESDRLGRPSGASMLPNSNADTEMIDLNLSTKLLGVPHSVVNPFDTRPVKEMSKSPSELSTKSSPLAAHIHSPSPQGSNVCTSPLSHGQSPSPTISLPNYSLDLSRFNLPPAVRKALADRYSGKKVSSAASGSTAESSDGRRSHPLFTYSTRTDGQFDNGKKVSPLPARLRSRGQRSVSLDSPLMRKENLHGEGSSRSVLFERGNFHDMNRFLNWPSIEGHEKSSLISLGHNLGGLPKRSGVMLPSANVSPLSTQATTAKEDTHELHRRGLIDLSSTSYFGEIPATSVNQVRSPAATRSTIDNSQSPSRPSMLQGRGLIDLNSSMALGGREAANPETLSVMKRKRVNSTEGSECPSSSPYEQLIKRLKQEQATPIENTAATYRPGINVQELLTIEREEQNQLQNLHAVQSRLKSVRAQIQKLCTELDSLSGEEQRITLKMGELRNQRLSVLENACYERQVPTTRIEIVTREVSVSTADGQNSFSFSSGSGKSDTSDLSYSARQDKCQDDVSVAKDKIHRGPSNKDAEEEVYISGNTSRAKEKESFLKESNFSDGPVGTATNFGSKGEIQRQKLPHEKVLEKLNAGKLAESSKQLINFSEGANNITPASGAQINEKAACREPAEETSDMRKKSDTNSFGADFGLGAVRTSGNLWNAPVRNPNGANKDKGAREGLMKKMKQMYHPEKAPCRKKSSSDGSISKNLEVNRKKIQSVRENMERWKSQEESEGLRELNDNETQTHTSPFRSHSAESHDNSNVVEGKCLPRKMLILEKNESRKTTKELKKSSFFQSSKKSFKELQRNKVNKSQLREKEKSNKTDTVPVKRRKVEDTSCNKSSVLPLKEETESKLKDQVVSAAAHTTTTDLEGPGSEERGYTEDEIPTRDVDSQLGNMSSKKSSRPSHLKIPSSSVESLKKSLLNTKDGRPRGVLATKFPGHTGAVCGLRVNNGHLFTCSTDKTTRSFNIQTGECVKKYQGHHLAVNCIEVSTEKDRLFTGSNDQTVRSYNIKSGNCTHKFTFDGRVMCLHTAFDLLFVGLSTGVVASIDLMNNICQERLHCHEPRGVSCLATATEGQRKLLCSGSFDSTIAIRDCKTGLLIRTLCDHSMTVLCIQVVENILYSGSADMKVQAHNLNSGELLRSFEGHPMSVSGLQIIGNVLVTSCLDKLIRCYDLTSADLLQVYGGQMDMIFSVHVNNGRIYSGARDGSVVAVKLDLRVYHSCKWRDCDLNFGVVTHLKNHLREHHVMEEGSVEACHWAECGHKFSADDDISTVLKHVLGHVPARTARKSAK